MLRAAIIGTGRSASLLEKDPLRKKPCTHAGCYAAHPRTSLVAGADTNPEHLATFGADWGIGAEHLYADYREMLEAESPDIVSVCAYAPERYEMAVAAIEAGAKALWLEKAVACSVAEAEDLRARLRAAGVAATVNYPRRLGTLYNGISTAIRDRRWGRLRTVIASFSGDLVHTGTHAYDVLRMWCGDVTSVTGWVDTGEAGPLIHDAGGHGHLSFDSGVQAFVAGARRDYFIFQFDLHFERGRVFVGNDVRTLLQPGPARGYVGFDELFPVDSDLLPEVRTRGRVEDLLSGMEQGKQPLMSVDHAVESLRIAVALFQSHRMGGKAIARDEVDPELRIVSV